MSSSSNDYYHQPNQEGPMATSETTYPALEREQKAFDSQLTVMLKAHAGEFVLFKNARPVEFFKSYDDAYRAGIERFGLDGAFLVSDVKRRAPETTSISWQSGVMF